jgi:dipeptidyl aminopeptidase/acylaminoacyl peptidase
MSKTTLTKKNLEILYNMACQMAPFNTLPMPKSEKVKFFRWHPHLEKILIASENYVKVWDLKKNLEYEFQIEIKTTTKVEIKNVKWNEKGNRIIVTTNEKILIFNDRLNLDTTINQSLSEETILIDENHLFPFCLHRPLWKREGSCYED